MNKRLISFLFCILTSVITVCAQPAPDNTREVDRVAIRGLIEKIFQAFIDKDHATLKATHSADWAGYFTNSRSLTQGIDGYMNHVSRNLSNKDTGMLSFKFEEFNINFQDDVALVFYVANVLGKSPMGTGNDKYRSLDVYAKRNGEWIQIGSNLARHTDALGNPVPINPQLKQRILEAREAVWRAWFSNDQAVLEKMIPNEAIAINGEGKWSNRTEILAGAKQFAEGGGKLVRIEFPRTEIQMYGNAITLYTTYLFETELGGKRRIKTGSGTETFVLRNNEIVNTGWLLADTK